MDHAFETNHFRCLHFRCLAPALLAAIVSAGCNGAPPELPADHPLVADTGAPPRLAADVVLATVGSKSISAGDLDAAIAGMPSAARLEYASPETVRDLLETLVDRRLMATAALAEGLARDPEVKKRLAGLPPGSSPEQVLASAWQEKQLGKVPAPAEQDIAAYYRDHADEFTVPARVQVTRAIAATEPAAGRLRSELARGATAADLQALAAGEVLGAGQLWLQDVPKQPEVTAIAMALKQGEVSRAVPVPDGFLVMRADRVEASRQRPLAEVHAGIRESLAASRQREAGAALRERLRNGAKISVDEGALVSYRAPIQTAF